MRKKAIPNPIVNDQKYCSSCEHYKPFDQFSPDPRSKTGLRGYCKSCCADRTQQRYSVVGSQVKNKKALERRTQIKRELVDQLGGCCARCGYDESLAALDFHHTDGTKEGQIARLITGAVYRGLTDLTKEVSKCVVLCSNCHRTLHAGEWR